jgi:two-component system sensor kinase FixL
MFALGNKEGGYDVADQEAAEDLSVAIVEALRSKRTEEKMLLHTQIVKNMAEGVYLIRTGDGVIVYTNKTFERMFGYDPGELVNKHVSIVNAPSEKSPEEIANDIIQSLKEKGTWSGEVHNIKKDGTPLWCHANVSTFDHHDFGEVWVSVHQDISKRKKVEEELKKYHDHLEELVKQRTAELAKANEQLKKEIEERNQAEEALRDAQEELIRKEKLATIGNLSGGIAHELRNPLGVIDSSAYYLKKRLKEANEKVQEHLDRIKAQVGRATAIIESLLNLTRIKEPRLETLDLKAITSEGIATSTVPDTVNVVRKFPEEGVLVSADREQLSLALRNIVANAVEAMTGEGTLTVTVCRASDDRAELSFIDTGPGIDPENLDRIFEPLFTTRAKGIGFGLSIARMVIDRHGGTIEARSETGRGATIIVRLPLYVDRGKEE